MGQRRDLFISYTGADIAWAEWIADTWSRLAPCSRLPILRLRRPAAPGVAETGRLMSERPKRQTTSSVEWLPRRHSAVLGWSGGSEKVDEQLGDALRLVVMHPVRGVGQALDAVKVGHVIMVGLG